MATSPFVLGIASALLLIIIAFVASFVVVYLFPTLATPSYSLNSRRGITSTLASPLTVANAIIGRCLSFYDKLTWNWWWGYADYWDEPIEDAYPPLQPVDPRDIGVFEWLFHRLLLGLSAVGSFSFVTFIYQMSLMGVFRLRALGRRGNRRETAGNVAAVLIIIFILIGIAKTVRDLYRFNRKMAQRMLSTIEDVILEV